MIGKQQVLRFAQDDNFRPLPFSSEGVTDREAEAGNARGAEVQVVVDEGRGAPQDG